MLPIRMKIIFQLRYRTQFGQSLWLTGPHPRFGNGRLDEAVPLHYLDGETWQATLEIPAAESPDAKLTYNYLLRGADGSMTLDWGSDRRLDLAALKADEVLVVDAWNHAGFVENAFYTEPFQAVLLKPNRTEVLVVPPAHISHTLQVKAPLLAKGQALCLLGGGRSLGNWDTTAPLLLNRSTGESWLTVHLDLRQESFPIAYKYGVFDVDQQTFVGYEAGENRLLRAPSSARRRVIVRDGFAALPATTWKGAGVAIPVFSLRSRGSFGIGEFTDLKLLVDWCRRTGLRLIQILPVNDTSATHTWTDSYPYAAISAFALHPIYLNLSALAEGAADDLLAEAEPERIRLNALDSVDYEAVWRAKHALVRRLFPSRKAVTFRSRAYREFFRQNRHWLVPYAGFCYLRDSYGTADFQQWPAHRVYNAGEIEALAAEGSPAHEAIALQYFIQFHLHRQLREAAEYAHAHGVILKGDIAIGVSRFGVDTWQEPELYRLEEQAGAPPDAFAAKGQNWGFPTYNWPRMGQDGFAWWKQRFEQMSHYFDAFRVDHILGFFRIWSIPRHAVEGILGRFVPAIPLTPDEFAARGIPLDRDRYVKPFNNDEILAGIFGANAALAKEHFLHANAAGGYDQKPEFATQRQVEQYLAALAPDDPLRELQIGLFDLISNVILLDDPAAPGQQYHFRFGMEQTPSFRLLDPPTQARLRDWYVDYFFRRQDDFWMKEAMRKLPALMRATQMLICGEDLGMVPDCVPVTLQQLGLLALEVQRMPKALNQEFSYPQNAPYLSVVTPGTHDMSTIRGWWKEDRDLTQKFFNQVLGRSGIAPAECDPGLNRAVVQQHLASPAMWSIFQLQDLLGLSGELRRPDADAERINVPAIPRYYWRYRMHLTLEALVAADEYNADLRALVQQHRGQA